MEVFVLKALEKLRAESSRSHTEFRESCDSVIRTIQENSQRPNRPPDDGDADKYWQPFQLAVEVKSSKMKAMALDAIEKMVAFGYLKGVARVKPLSGGAERALIDNVVEAICSCRDDPADAVQLQVIKALNTAVSSTNVAVHEGSLLLAVRAVYHVCLGSRNAVNRNTARGTLRQMLAIVFVRMEKWHREHMGSSAVQQQQATAGAAAAGGGEVAAAPAPAPADSAAPPSPVPASAPAAPTTVKVKRVVKVTRMETRSVTETVSTPAAPAALMPYLYPAAFTALDLGRVVGGSQTSRTVSKEVPVETEEEVEVEEAAAPATAAAAAAKAPATPVRPAAAAAAATPSAPVDAGDALGGLPSQAHRDAFLVFRSLCRLTAVTEEEAPLLPAGGGILAALGGAAGRPAPAVDPVTGREQARVPVLSDEALLANPVALQSKLLSLELVVGLLESAGPALQNGPKFIATIKTYLCQGLLKNFVSTIGALSSLSLKAFMALVKGFKRHVAPEVEVFISSIFLRMLTSSTASQEQKLSVLTAFRSMVSDPGSVLEMFLNYDCAEGRQNVFEDSIRTLAGISQGPGKAGEAIAAMALATQQAAAAAAQAGEGGPAPVPRLPPGIEAGAIKAAAIQALSSVIQSMVVLADAAAKQIAESEGRSLMDVIGGAGAGSKGGKAGPAGASSGKDKEDADDDKEDEAVLESELGGASAGGPPGTPMAAGSSAGPMSPPASSSSSSTSSALARSYEEQKRRKALLERAAVKFAVKPKKGIEFLQTHGLCGPSPADIAACFHELADVLDKTAIGDYMGEDKAAHIETLHAYVDQLDFTGLAFDDAIRKYLAGFRLPGEAQKIDRMMEKLAERYCKCNPGVFPTADTAFILAYSIIMLHTDAHNPNIKPEKKMTRDGFLRNNRGIGANGADLPPELLYAIYDSIVSRPFTLREDDALRHKRDAASTVVDERARREMQLKERADIVAAGQEKLSSLTSARRQQLAGAGGDDGSGTTIGGLSLSSYVSVSDVQLADHIRPMFDLVWGPLLAVWSVNFEQAGDGPEEGWTVNTCLAGFNQAIHVAGALRMETARDTLVATLCKFSGLALGEAAAGCVGGGPGSVRELRGKHVAAVRALLSMAYHEGNNLGVAWGPTLAVVSAVARLQNAAMGGREDASFLQAGGPDRVAQALAAANTSAARREAERIGKLIERDGLVDRQNAALLAAHVPEADVSRLFARSGALSSDAIVDFVSQLGAVSLYELASCVTGPPDFAVIGKHSGDGSIAAAPSLTGPGPMVTKPRIFSLQKVVEVADFNMEIRPRMAWAKLWDSMSKYFTAVCCSTNTQVAMFAIDSLKQLSLKFCAKPEMKSFNFQNKFLHPFAAIMEATAPGAVPAPAVAAPAAGGRRGASAAATGKEIRELVLHVCANIIRARSANIQSGWRSFLAVYAAAAADSDELLVSLAFSMAHEVVDTHFTAVAAAGCYTDAVKCMVAFGSNPHPLFALRSIDHLSSLGAHLARGMVPIEGEDKEEEAAAAAAAAGGAGAGGAASAGKKSVPTTAVTGTPSGPEEDKERAKWYDLDGPENADVVDDRHDRGLAARMGGGASDADAPKVGGRGYSMENFDGAEPEEGGGRRGAAHAHAEDEEDVDPDQEAAAEARAAEDAMDNAMLSADGQPGGKIRRFTDSQAHLQLWWPLLTGLAGLISADSRLPVRMRALHALFALLRRYGPSFDRPLWALVYSGVLMPMFDDVFHVLKEGDGEAVAGLARGMGGAAGASSSSSGAGGMDMEGGDAVPRYSLAEFSSRAIPAVTGSTALGNVWPGQQRAGAAGAKGGKGARGGPALDEHEWLRTTCMPALSSLVRLQSRFFTRLGFLLPGLLRLVERCIDQEIEGLARVGVASLRLLLAEAGPRFNEATWGVVAASLGRMFLATTPAALLECRAVLLGEGAEDGLEEGAEGEGQDGEGQGEGEGEAAAAQQAAEAAAAAAAAPEPVVEAPAPAPPADPPAISVWSTAPDALPVPVDTAYGQGTLLSLPAPGAAKPIARVQLKWGVVFIHVPTHVAGLRASLGIPEPAKVVEAAPAPVPAAAPAKPAAPAPAPAKPPAAPARLTSLPFNSVRVVTQCVVQLELIGAVGVLTEAQLSSLSLGHVESLLGLLQGSASFARKFNADRLLRRALWDIGFMRFAKHNKLPSLLRQETAATKQLLALLLRLYTYDGERAAAAGLASPTTGKPWAALSITHLKALIKGILARYTQLAVDVQRAQVLALPPHMHASLQFTYSGGAAWGGYTPERDALLTGEHSRDLFREAAAYGPMVLLLLDGLLAFTDAQFRANLPWLYPLLTGLVTCGSVEIRQRLSQVFAVRLRKLLPMDGKDEGEEAAAAGEAAAAAVGGAGAIASAVSLPAEVPGGGSAEGAEAAAGHAGGEGEGAASGSGKSKTPRKKGKGDKVHV